MRKALRFVLFSALILAPPFLLLAEEDVKVTTIFDKRTVALTDEIKLTIRISGGKVNVLRPRLPHVDPFDSYYTGRSNQFTFVNGRSESTTTFSYVLIPKRVGKFALPPIEVEVDSQIFRTDPIEIEVTGSPSSAPVPRSPSNLGPGMTSLSPPSAVGPFSPTVSQAGSQAPWQSIQKPIPQTVPSENDSNVFLNVFADKQVAYPNEQILLTYSVFTRFSARAEQFEKDPNLNGFWVEEIPMERDYQPEKVVYDGLQYVKADVRRLALFPTATGTFEIEPGVFRVTVKKESRSTSLFDDFFDESFFGGSFFSQREQKLLTARPLKIAVRPFPEQGKPVDFTGMVGQFRMSSSVDRRAVKQNEPILLTLVIEGEGNIEMLERPKISDLRDIKVYDSDSSTELSRNIAGVQGRKTFEMTLIPTTAGEFVIPSLSFSYFDPRQGRYQTLKTDSHPIKVSPGPAVPLPGSTGDLGLGRDADAKKKVTRESSDIHFIKENFRLNRRKLLGMNAANFLLIINGLLSVSCLIFFFVRRHEEKLDQNVALKRSSYAAKTAQKGVRLLMKWSASSRRDDVRNFFEEAPKIMNQYFADKFNLSAHGMTFDDLEQRLKGKGWDTSRLEVLREFYEVCDQVRFATTKDLPQTRCGELTEVIQKMIDSMEKS